MTKRDIVSLALIIIGVYLGLYCLATLLMMGPTFWHLDWTDIISIVSMLFTILLLTSVIVLVYVFVRHSDGVAQWLVPADTGEQMRPPSRHIDVAAVAFAVLGLALCARAVPRLAGAGVSFALAHSAEFENIKGLGIRAVSSSVAGEVIRCALGAVLFVKADALATVWRRWQETDGADASSPDATEYAQNEEHES